MKVGDVLDLVVVNMIGRDKENGSYLLSKCCLDARKVQEDIERDFQNGKVIKAPVISVARGGLATDVGVYDFVSASVVEDHFVAGSSNYRSKTLNSKVIEIEPSENRLILPYKAVVEDEREEGKKEIPSTIHEGSILSGHVARLTDFGVFVDLGGIDGLVHILEISHSHVTKSNDVLTISDEVNAKALSINPE